MNRRGCTPEVMPGEESDMDTAGHEVTRAQLQARRKLIQLELASVKCKIERVRGLILFLEEPIATLSQSHRRAA
jgi:hypothetical protein